MQDSLHYASLLVCLSPFVASGPISKAMTHNNFFIAIEFFVVWLIDNVQSHSTDSSTSRFLRGEEHKPFWSGARRVIALHEPLDNTVNALFLSGFQVAIINGARYECLNTHHTLSKYNMYKM